MARFHDYPRWRYLTMQGVMWVLLACTVGVAALVDLDIRRRGAGGGLTQDVTLDSIAIKVPEAWIVTDEPGGADETGEITSIRLTEPLGSPLRRTIVISEQPAGDGGGAAPTTRPRGARGRRDQSIRFGADGTGQLVVTRTALPEDVAGMDVDASQLHVTAAGRLDDGTAVTITLDALQVDNRPSTDQAVQLVKRIAASIVRREEKREDKKR